jgi:hypothetical protein
MEKQKFDVRCPNALFEQTALGPPEHEKLCIDDSRPAFCGNRTGPTQASQIVRWCIMSPMHQNELRAPKIPPDAKKNKFGVMCPGALFMESVLVPTWAWKIVYPFCTPQKQQNTLRDPKIAPDVKKQL